MQGTAIAAVFQQQVTRARTEVVGEKMATVSGSVVASKEDPDRVRGFLELFENSLEPRIRTSLRAIRFAWTRLTFSLVDPSI